MARVRRLGAPKLIEPALATMSQSISYCNPGPRPISESPRIPGRRPQAEQDSDGITVRAVLHGAGHFGDFFFGEPPEQIDVMGGRAGDQPCDIEIDCARRVAVAMLHENRRSDLTAGQCALHLPIPHVLPPHETHLYQLGAALLLSVHEV